MAVTYTLRIWRIRPGEAAGDYASTRPYDETRYVDLPGDMDAARAEIGRRGILDPGDTFKFDDEARRV